MKLTSFMNLYKIKKTDEEKLDLIRSHIKNEYVPYEKKADVAKAIIQVCYWQKNNTESELGTTKFHIDSVAKHMLTCMSIIDLYTDIERSKQAGTMVEDFNKLNELGIFDMVNSAINERELEEFKSVVQMTADDAIANEYEPHAFISNQVERFGSLLGTVLGPFLKELDLSTVQGMINNLGKEQE